MPPIPRILSWTLFAPLLLPVAVGEVLSDAGEEVSADANDSAPLFQSHEPIKIRIKGPMRTFRRERSDEEDLPAVAVWQEADGRTIEAEIGLRARGNYRRRPKTCSLPPIRLNFKTSTVAGTIFQGQDKLKLVTHCRDRSRRYREAVLREYLTYRMLNTMTDLSYRVRRLEVTYEDTESNRADYESIAFVIEHKDGFSARTGLPILSLPRTYLKDLDPAYTNLTSVFQYMIGNTDFSPLKGAADADCCHNVNLYGDAGTAIFPVPYDFDMSGMIDAEYASPNPRFRLRNVRQRLYRGRCAFNDQLPATIQAFNDKRNELYALADNADFMENSSRNKMRRYLDSFFQIIDDNKAVDKRIIRECVK